MIDFQQLTTDEADLAKEVFKWGMLTWLCNAKLMPGAVQTVGLCHMFPGQSNPVHFHPNCEEVLHLLSGTGRHSFNGDEVELRAGMTIRIPTGVQHNLTNTGETPLTCLIVFSSGERETVFLS